jgi:predicted alpha/beta-hydrolase family hydrolase
MLRRASAEAGSELTSARGKVTTGSGQVSTLWDEPKESMRGVLFLAHGAGSNMEHASMSSLAAHLVQAGIGVLRFNFLYSELQRGRPDTEETLIQTWIDVWNRGLPRTRANVPRLAGGRSMGGRMASLAAAKRPLAFRPDGLVFFAYPLHPPGQPDRLRTHHLDRIELPMLFLSGTRDNFLSVELMENAVAPLPRAALYWLEGADHGFHVLKRSGRSDEDIVAEAVRELGDWLGRCVASDDGPEAR